MKAKITVDGQPKTVELVKGPNLSDGVLYLSKEDGVFYIEGNPLRYVMKLFRKLMALTAKHDKDPLETIAGIVVADLLDFINNSEELSKEQLIYES